MLNQFSNDDHVKPVRYGNLPDGFYHLSNPGGETCLVRLYTPSEPPYRGIGFGVWDGGGFMPLWDIHADSTLTPITVMPKVDSTPLLLGVEVKIGPRNYKTLHITEADILSLGEKMAFAEFPCELRCPVGQGVRIISAPTTEPVIPLDPTITDTQRIERLSRMLEAQGIFIYGNGNPGKGEGRSPDAIRAWIDSH